MEWVCVCVLKLDVEVQALQKYPNPYNVYKWFDRVYLVRHSQVTYQQL